MGVDRDGEEGGLVGLGGDTMGLDWAGRIVVVVVMD